MYEKQVTLPAHVWQKNQNLVIQFNIKDSTSHQLFLTVRHTQQFPFDHLLTKLSIQDTAKHTIATMNINAPLTDQNNHWSGTIMDDIYYCRFKISPTVFLTPGNYRFVLSHEMKENTIPYILNVGIAIGK